LQPERTLYLAIPLEIHELFFQQAFIQKVLVRQQVKLIVYDSDRQEIKQWIN
jgi:hypothetical protein